MVGKRLRHVSDWLRVAIGTAKDVYRQFWKDLEYITRAMLLATAYGNPNGKVMALRFDDNERLGRTRNWDDLRAVLRGVRQENKSCLLLSPVKIPEEAFVELYGE